MSLLDSLAGARLITVDEDLRLVFAWFGGDGVNIYDDAGAEVDYFTIGGTHSRLTLAHVRGAIERMIRYTRERRS